MTKKDVFRPNARDKRARGESWLALFSARLDDAFERWYDWNRAHLKESKATYQAEFMGRYELAKYPLGSQQMLQDAWARVTTDALPPDVQLMPCNNPELKLMAAFCRELQRMAGPPPKSFSSPAMS